MKTLLQHSLKEQENNHTKSKKTMHAYPARITLMQLMSLLKLQFQIYLSRHLFIVLLVFIIVLLVITYDNNILNNNLRNNNLRNNNLRNNNLRNGLYGLYGLPGLGIHGSRKA
ncbi:hypothetical protein ABFS83_14G027200 [Erythranthe nasuta]